MPREIESGLTPGEVERRRLFRDKIVQSVKYFNGRASALKGEWTKFQKNPHYDRIKLRMQADSVRTDIQKIMTMLESDTLDPDWVKGMRATFDKARILAEEYIVLIVALDPPDAAQS